MSLRVLFRAACVVVVVLGVTACQTFPTKEFNKAAHPELKSIALAPIGLPIHPQVMIVNAAGNNFGLIGTLVEAGRAANAGLEAEANFSAGGLDYKAYVISKIQEALLATQMQVQPLSGERPKAEKTKFLTKLPNGDGANAVLDIYVSYIGYVAAGATTDYRPAMHIEARLVDVTTKKVLFADQVYYNNFTPRFAKTAITIEPDPNVTFKNREAMSANPAAVANGMRNAIDAVAAELAKQFL